MGKILFKRVNQESSPRIPSRLLAGLVILSLSAGQQTLLFADEIGVPAQVADKGITLADKTSKTVLDSNTTDKKLVTTNDFLISSVTLNKADDKNPDPITALLGQVVDGTVSKSQINKDSRVITVTLNNSKSSDKNQAFLQNAAGPLQSPAKASIITFTLNADGTKIQKSEFTDGTVKYEVTFSDDSKTITQSVVSDMKDAANLANNYTVTYAKDSDNKATATMKFPDYQNDGSSVIVFTQTGAHDVTLTFFGDESETTPFRTATISENSRGVKTIHSALQFGNDPAFTEYDATVNAKGDITNLILPTSYGLLTLDNLGTAGNIYDLLENKISLTISDIQVREYFLTTFEQIIGKSVFTVDDLKNNITVVSQEPTYARLNFMGHSLILTCNDNPDTYERMPLIVVPDVNHNGVTDPVDLKIVKAVMDTARTFLDSNVGIDYKDFAANAIVLDSNTVFYQGQIITLEKRNNFLKINYKNGGTVFIAKVLGKKQKLIRRLN